MEDTLPTQFLGPVPNGRKAYGSLDFLPSGLNLLKKSSLNKKISNNSHKRNLSGSNFSGSGYNFGSRCNAQIDTDHIVPFGINIPLYK